MNKYKYLFFSFLSIFFVLFYCSFNNDSHAAKKKPAPLKAPVQDECTPGPDPNACIEKEFEIGTPGSTIPWMNLKDCLTEGTTDAMIMEGGGGCQYAYVDCSNDSNDGMTYGIINIGMGGRLVFLDQDVDVSIDTIYVSGGSAQIDNLPIGQLVIGTLTENKKKLKDCPIESKITLEFTGNPLEQSDTHYLRRKGIIVEAGGELIMHGEKGVIPSDNVPFKADSPKPDIIKAENNSGTDSWTYLAKPAGPDIMGVKRPVPTPEPDVPPATTLFLSKQTKVDWEENDWIVVASTDFASHHSEFVQVLEVKEPDTVTLSHDTPLKYYHFGGPGPSDRPNDKDDIIKNDPNDCNNVPLNGISVQGLPKSFCDGPERNYGVDERAEVGLISRNIKLTSDAETTTTMHYGGQIRIMEDFTIVEIEGVEIEKFGQDIFTQMPIEPPCDPVVSFCPKPPLDVFMSAYPIHFHQAVDLPNDCGDDVERPCVVINSNSIHHSYNKCITIHDTNGVFIENNICARAVGHSFYLETGTENGNTFDRNLAIGAMATEWSPDLPNGGDFFWKGDYLADVIDYDGFMVATTTHPNRIEEKAPTAFWITNQQNTYENNSVSGCQLLGRGYWFLTVGNNKNLPFLPFLNNRVHGCYFGVDTVADNGALDGVVQNPFPQESDNGHIKNIIAVLDGITATRNRNRGIWARNAWFVIDDARLATNRDSVSLVSAGGIEGVPPGFWALLSNSVLVGVSENNPERFGPCPDYAPDGSCVGMGEYRGNGFPSPKWNFYGMMFYDGPARLEKNRFVNFNIDIEEHLTTADKTFLQNYIDPAPNVAPPYEGDAALGWFQANDQSYPPTQYTLYNIWENVDFRHQIYTELVNIDTFNDGDKNTVILDRDSTLTGYIVVDSEGDQIKIGTGLYSDEVAKFPISLNNLAFNGSPYTVNECLSIGAQDEMREQRETSLISPHSYATLQVQSFDPTMTLNPAKTQTPHTLAKKKPITFKKDQLDYGEHSNMTLHGRNNTQIYEPKVASGFGYTLHSEDSQVVSAIAGKNIIAPPAAFPRFMSFSFADAHSGKLKQDGTWEKPFRTRIGVCYKTERGPDVTNLDPANFFKVEKGKVSYGGNTEGADDMNWKPLLCNNFAFTEPSNYDAMGGEKDPTQIMPECQEVTPSGGQNASFSSLSHTSDWAQFIDSNNDDKYFWDADKGMLFFYMQQNEPPAGGFTPTGSCDGVTGSPTTDNPVVADACKNAKEFYPCPVEGCEMYTIRVVDEDEIGYKPNLGSQFVCGDGSPCPSSGECTDGVCKPKTCKLCDTGPKKGIFCEFNMDCNETEMDAKCMESPPGESCYGRTMCDDIYEGSTTTVPPENYTQGYPPNHTVDWQVDMLKLPDGEILTKDKILPMPNNMVDLKFCDVNGSIGKVCVVDSTCGIEYGTDAQIHCIEKTINFPYNEPKDEVKASCYPIMP